MQRVTKYYTRYNHWKWCDQFSRYSLFRSIRQEIRAAFLMQIFPDQSYLHKDNSFVFQTPPLVYSRTHFSSSSIEIYTLSPLLSLLSFRFSNILIMEIVNPTGSIMFLPIFSKYIWCFWKKRIYKMYRIFELLNLFAVYFFLSSITKVETILFDKIFFTFTISLFEGSLSLRFLHYFKFTLQSWIYGINSTSRNLNLKSPESTATSLLRFSNICWCAFLADTISMKNIFNKRGQ